MGEMFNIGKIVNTQGLKGEVRIYTYTDYKEQFEEFETVYVGEDNIEMQIEKLRFKGDLAIVKFKGFDHINEVEKLKNLMVYIDRDEEDEMFFHSDMIGFKVVCEINGELGTLKDVIINPRQDVYVIESKRFAKDILVPAVDEFILEIDEEKELITVKLIEGMI
jgi:16S rRNA processing protein RimM